MIHLHSLTNVMVQHWVTCHKTQVFASERNTWQRKETSSFSLMSNTNLFLLHGFGGQHIIRGFSAAGSLSRVAHWLGKAGVVVAARFILQSSSIKNEEKQMMSKSYAYEAYTQPSTKFTRKIIHLHQAQTLERWPSQSPEPHPRDGHPSHSHVPNP